MKIVVTEPLHLAEWAKQTLADLGSVSYGPFDDRALARELVDCDVIMVRLGPPYRGCDHLRCAKASIHPHRHHRPRSHRPRCSTRRLRAGHQPARLPGSDLGRDRNGGALLRAAARASAPHPCRHGPCALRRLGSRPVLGEAAQGQEPRRDRLWANRRHGGALCCFLRHGRSRVRQDRRAKSGRRRSRSPSTSFCAMPTSFPCTSRPRRRTAISSIRRQ